MSKIDSPKDRQKLFLELAGRDGGITAEEVYEKASSLGDGATPEAYYNMGRRLAHKGILLAEKRGRKTFYSQGAGAEGIWLTENEIRDLIDPDMPLISLSAMELNSENIRNIREDTWIKIRNLLSDVNARELFFEGIKSLADHVIVVAQDRYRKEDNRSTRDDQKELEESLQLLKTVCKQGLGLSQDALIVPDVNRLLRKIKDNSIDCLYNEGYLKDELDRRIEDVSFIVEIDESDKVGERNYLAAAIDGSSRSGITGYKEPLYDLSVGVSPDVSVQTSIALINRQVKTGNETKPVFSRLPEKPEDMQQQENRFTVMNRMFHPELSDSEYLHAVFCAMNLLEVRATSRVMRRWDYKNQVEIPPAEIVLRDGTLVPHDRNFSHYQQDNTYGRIVRELIERNWNCVAQAEMDGASLVGLVKQPQVSPITPMINWYISQAAAKSNDVDLQGWPQASLNKLTDQQILTRILTAGRKSSDPWYRTALVLRPFHATSSFNMSHKRSEEEDIPQSILAAQSEKLAEADDMTDHHRAFWENFRGLKDSYVQMIANVWYAYFFVGTTPRLDINNALPRIEFSFIKDIREEGEFPEQKIRENLDRTLATLNQIGFDVSNEHSMFQDVDKLDIMPKLCIDAHNLAKDWMRDFMLKIREYIGMHSRLFRQTRSPASFDVHGYLRKEEILKYAETVKEQRLAQGGSSEATQLVDE